MRKEPPSVEHLKYFKVWAIANTITSGVLIILTVLLTVYISTQSEDMNYMRAATSAILEKMTTQSYETTR